MAGFMALPTLTAVEAALLREVRLSDEDHGGLSGAELSTDEYDAMRRLCELGLVEAVGEYGEAPDGEEDEREPKSDQPKTSNKQLHDARSRGGADAPPAIGRPSCRLGSAAHAPHEPRHRLPDLVR